MEILIAFDKFKGSLSATEACTVAAKAVRDRFPDAHTEEAPLTDGGEGFVELLTGAARGEIRRCRVTGPLGLPVEACFGLVDVRKLPAAIQEMLSLPPEGSLAVVEMAQASGFQLVPDPKRDPWTTTTRGTGEILQLAAALKPAAILVGLGGSATHDLGLGALGTLGLQGIFADGAKTRPANLVPATWSDLSGFAGKIEPELPPLWIASDVDNPLLGERGAATVFAPQKGLRTSDLAKLEEETARVAGLLCDHFGRDHGLLSEPGSGAAGGIGAGFRIACGARGVSGFSLVRAWLDLDRKLAEADLILTGEGAFDESSLEGKGPGVLVRNGEKNGKKILVFAGRLRVPEKSKRDHPSCRFVQISPGDMPTEQAMSEGAELLGEAIRNELQSW